MTGPTHRQFAVTSALLASALMYKNGLTEVNYYLTIPIMLSSAKYGALFPDVDHTWQNVKDKTVPNKIINTLIHATGGKHRSWQTHSIDIVLICAILSSIVPRALLVNEIISVVNFEVMQILCWGFMAGWISHIFSDMLTHAGVRVLCFSNNKIALVPKSIGSLRFNTGNEWESFVYKAMKIINIPLGMFILVLPYMEDIITFFQTLIV